MSTTSPVVLFDTEALQTKEDGTPTADFDLQPHSKAADLAENLFAFPTYATYEPDFWLLDGTRKLLPDALDDVHVGIVSLDMSDENGDFPAPLELEIEFSGPHDTENGLTLYFEQRTEDYPDEITVTFYDGEEGELESDTYYPDAPIFATSQTVTGFEKIVIEFVSTNNPYRYLRLTRIDYDDLTIFEGNALKAASMVHELSPISIEAPIGTFDMRLHSDDGDFNPINPAGKYSTLIQYQKLYVYEIVDGETVLMGVYYLDTWENVSDTEIELRCIDLLGVLDRRPFYAVRDEYPLQYTGMWYTLLEWLTFSDQESWEDYERFYVEDLLSNALALYNIPYELDPSLEGHIIAGWIPHCSYREALQLICFRIGAYIDCREGVLKFIPAKLASEISEYDFTITDAEKGMSQAVSLRPLVAGVEILTHSFLFYEGDVYESRYTSIFSNDLDEGIYTIMHDQSRAARGYRYVGSTASITIIKHHANYTTIDVTTAGFVLAGVAYKDDKTRKVGIYIDGIETFASPNIVKVDNATLITEADYGPVLQRAYDYYQQRLIQKAKLFAPEVRAGDVVLVDTIYNKKIRGVVEKMSIDLAKGMIADVEIVGVEHVED